MVELEFIIVLTEQKKLELYAAVSLFNIYFSIIHWCIAIPDTDECNEGDVRLVDGATADDGRVEICFYGLWGSVCDTRWDYRDAEVVCRQLQYDGRKSIPQ